MNSLRTLWGQNDSLFKYTSADPLFDLSQHTNSTSQLSFTSKRVSSACGTFSRKVELYTTRNLSKSSVVFRCIFLNSIKHSYSVYGAFISFVGNSRDHISEMGQLESVYIEGIDDADADSILHGDLTVERIAKIIKDGDVHNIVVMSGAGISVNAGIPDFRTPGTGLYYNLQQYNLPTPESMFDIEYFRQNPESFYSFVMVCV